MPKVGEVWEGPLYGSGLERTGTHYCYITNEVLTRAGKMFLLEEVRIVDHPNYPPYASSGQKMTVDLDYFKDYKKSKLTVNKFWCIYNLVGTSD